MRQWYRNKFKRFILVQLRRVASRVKFTFVLLHPHICSGNETRMDRLIIEIIDVIESNFVLII